MRCSPAPDRRFTMLELIGAMVVLGIVVTAWASHWQASQRLHRANLQRTAAIAVLDNTLERAAARGELTFAELHEILADEVAQAQLPRARELLHTVELRDGRVQLRIAYRDGRPLASVEVDP